MIFGILLYCWAVKRMPSVLWKTGSRFLACVWYSLIWQVSERRPEVVRFQWYEGASKSKNVSFHWTSLVWGKFGLCFFLYVPWDAALRRRYALNIVAWWKARGACDVLASVWPFWLSGTVILLLGWRVFVEIVVLRDEDRDVECFCLGWERLDVSLWSKVFILLW